MPAANIHIRSINIELRGIPPETAQGAMAGLDLAVTQALSTPSEAGAQASASTGASALRDQVARQIAVAIRGRIATNNKD